MLGFIIRIMSVAYHTTYFWSAFDPAQMCIYEKYDNVFAQKYASRYSQARELNKV
jgi:hypothetical protein